MPLLCINKGLRLWYCSISAFWHLIVSSKADHRSQLWLQEKQGVFSDLLEPRAQEVTSLWIIKDPRSKINSFTIKNLSASAMLLLSTQPDWSVFQSCRASRLLCSSGDCRTCCRSVSRAAVLSVGTGLKAEEEREGQEATASCCSACLGVTCCIPAAGKWHQSLMWHLCETVPGVQLCGLSSNKIHYKL